MTLAEALHQLGSRGDARVRAHNLKFGANNNQYGVKLGEIRKLAAAIKTDQTLAMQLWETGNVDAQLLAILILDLKSLSADALEKLVEAVNFSQVADWLSSYVVKQHPDKEVLRERWMRSAVPPLARAGWSLTAERVAKHPEGLDLPALLDRIDAEMPGAHALVQWTMNSTLAAIGIHSTALRDRALAIGERHGVYRDYPVSKGCTSPFAPIWINEIVRRQG